MIKIKGFLETSFSDWPGRLCAVLFLPTCNFRCPYCHNHSLVSHPEQFATIPLRDVLARLHSLRGWVNGVCLTGGEPTLHTGLLPLVQEIKGHGFLIKLDTNGSNPQRLEQLIETGGVDFVSMDVKAPLNPFCYSQAAGLPVKLEPILESIEILKRGRVDYEFRMTVVPEFHQEKDIRTLGHQLRAGPRLILQNFNPENPLDPRMKSVVPYDPKVLKEIEREVQGIG